MVCASEGHTHAHMAEIGRNVRKNMALTARGNEKDARAKNFCRFVIW